MAYANKTIVPISRTKEQIEKELIKAGASGFAHAQKGNVAFLAFQVKNIGIKINIRLPSPPSRGATKLSVKTYEQLCKTKWRCLLLVLKAKIESIESGIETFEEAFLSHIVLKDGVCVGEKVIPKIEQFNEVPTSLLLGL